MPKPSAYSTARRQSPCEPRRERTWARMNRCLPNMGSTYRLCMYPPNIWKHVCICTANRAGECASTACEPRREGMRATMMRGAHRFLHSHRHEQRTHSRRGAMPVSLFSQTQTTHRQPACLCPKQHIHPTDHPPTHPSIFSLSLSLSLSISLYLSLSIYLSLPLDLSPYIYIYTCI